MSNPFTSRASATTEEQASTPSTLSLYSMAVRERRELKKVAVLVGGPRVIFLFNKKRNILKM